MKDALIGAVSAVLSLFCRGHPQRHERRPATSLSVASMRRKRTSFFSQLTLPENARFDFVYDRHYMITVSLFCIKGSSIDHLTGYAIIALIVLIVLTLGVVGTRQTVG
jgi:hypothetical protein